MLRTTLSSARPRVTARIPLRSNFTNSTPLRTFIQRAQTSARFSPSKPNPSTNFTFSSNTQSRPATILQRLRMTLRSFHSSRARLDGKPISPNPTANLHSPKGVPEAEPTTLGGRLKKLSREYGWSAVGVYFMLSALDFPFCYIFVRILGTDRIGEWEHIVVTNIKKLIPYSLENAWHNWRTAMKDAERDVTGQDQISEGVEMAGWGVEEADANNKRDASLATQLALAYAIHKSFIFIRVPLTAAVTPKVVKVLRGWGWDIGKRTTKEAKALKRAAIPPKTKKT